MGPIRVRRQTPMEKEVGEEQTIWGCGKKSAGQLRPGPRGVWTRSISFQGPGKSYDSPAGHKKRALVSPAPYLAVVLSDYFFRSRRPAIPMRPLPRRTIVAGSGTGGVLVPCTARHSSNVAPLTRPGSRPSERPNWE
jgi:hypothetical protein